MQKLFLFVFATLFIFASSQKKHRNTIAAPTYKTLTGKAPLVLGHRGACGHRPDHTIASYTLAIDMGADFIEPDLVVTKDGILVCRHEPFISATTDVADKPEFASRKTKKMLDGIEINDWFVSDFTLAELKTLKAKQPFAGRPQEFNGRFEVPTFKEVIELVKATSKSTGRAIGIYPETKHPTFHEELGLKITDKTIDALTEAGWNNAEAAVFIQSFEVSNLKYIRETKKSTVKLVQLFDAGSVRKDGSIDNTTSSKGRPYDFVKNGDPRTYSDLASDAGMDFIKTYANGIGPWKTYIVPYTFTDANNDNKADDINNDGAIDSRDFTALPPTDFIERAHKKGLVVHAYTFRNEPQGLLKEYKNDPVEEYKQVFALGIDGVFTDFPNTAVSAK